MGGNKANEDEVPAKLSDQKGMLSRWFEERGFGFIASNGTDYFVHRKELPLRQQQDPRLHLNVIFDVRDNSAEKAGRAYNVREMSALHGIIAMWNPKGYGFIQNPDGGKDIFFHAHALPIGMHGLEKGMRVMFDLGTDRKTKKIQAENIRVEEEYGRRERDRDYREQRREEYRSPREKIPERHYRTRERDARSMRGEPARYMRGPADRYREERRTEEPISSRQAEPAYREYTRHAEPAYNHRPEPTYERRAEPTYERRAEPTYERRPEPKYERRSEPTYERRPESTYERRPEPTYEERRPEPMRASRYEETYRKPYRSEPERAAPPRRFAQKEHFAKKSFWAGQKQAASSFNRVQEPKRASYSQY